MKSFIFFSMSCLPLFIGCSDRPVKLSDKAETIEVAYINWACDCADFIETKDWKGNEAREEDCIFIEPANPENKVPESFYSKNHFGKYLRLTGHFYTDKGIPAGYEQKTPEKPVRAKVFRYDKLEIIDKPRSKRVSKSFLNPYDTLTFDKVIAYDYDGAGEYQIVEQGKLFIDNIKNKTELTREQIGKINKFLGDTSTYGGSTAACFDPHLGLVYYLKGKIVGYISICLECNFLESSLKIQAEDYKKTELCDSCFAHGFSKTGRKRINDLCKELRFSHCKDKLDGMFDE